MTVRHTGDHSLTRCGAAVGPLHLGIGAEFVEKNQISDSRFREPAEPEGALGYNIGAIPLGGMRGLFFRGNSNRCSVRQTVERLAGLLIDAATSASVASGLSLINLRIVASSLSSYAR